MSLITHIGEDEIARTGVDEGTLRRIAAKHNIEIPVYDIPGYLALLRSADLTTSAVDDLPDFIDSRLTPLPTQGGVRRFRKSAENCLNAWSHGTDLVAETPSSSLLRGRSVVVKDNISVGGVPFTCGTFPQLNSGRQEHPPSAIDASVVRRLLDSGARIIGTATCENYSLSTLSYSSASGPVHNPWQRSFNAGGSSSGPASLLGLRLARAAGVQGLEDAGADVDLAIGGDQAGSIRIPASYCGLYGLKPTHGLVPYTGIAGLHPMIDHVGPMALKLDDIAALLEALAGDDGMDGRMTPNTPLRDNVTPYLSELRAFSAAGAGTGRPLRVGVIVESLAAPQATEEVARVVRRAVYQHFSAAGAMVADVSMPLHLLGPSIWTASCRNNMGFLGIGARVPDMLTHNLPHWTPRWPPDQEMFDLLTRSNPAVMSVIFGETFLGEKFGPAVQAKAHRHVFQLREAYDELLAKFDVLITPTTPDVAPPHPDMRAVQDGGWTVLDKAELGLGVSSNTCAFNATGHPALSVPCGWATARDGFTKLPVGMQIIGRRWDDLGVLKAARVFETGGGGLGPRPGVGVPRFVL
ncbi:unnamed protein product [Clonostachys byssicola]|uniref:Amidase domain-containing protein n=1 Tax=Clonostachys byssicola TaxID=160290 RepID=A0A9N9Y1D6_9HYPO|nr:unnamed protein product [Clonostachys byssicola]